jgi:hypothetical protein
MPSVVALLLLLLLLQASLPRAAEWKTAQVSGLVPLALAAGTATVPHSPHLLVTVGGLRAGSASTAQSTVLLFDVNTGTMAQIAPSTQSAADAIPPAGLYGSGYAVAGDDLLMASGYQSNSVSPPGIWSLDLSGPPPFAWNPRPHQTRPSPRHGSAGAAFGDRFFVFGGANAGSTLGSLGFFSRSAGNWTDVAPSTAPPGGRWYPQIFAQSETKLLVFGGSHAVSYLGSDDMNVYTVIISQDGASGAWSTITTGGVGPNGFYCGWILAPPGSWGRPNTAVWFGYGSGTGAVFSNQIWELDTLQASWTAVPTVGSGPSARWKTSIGVVQGGTTCPQLVSYGGWGGNGVDRVFRLLSVCANDTISSVATTTTGSASPDSLASSPAPPEDTSFIVSVVVGVALLLLCAVVGLVVFLRRRNNSEQSATLPGSGSDTSDPAIGEPSDHDSEYNTVDLVAQQQDGEYNTVDAAAMLHGGEYNTVDAASAAGEYNTGQENNGGEYNTQ